MLNVINSKTFVCNQSCYETRHDLEQTNVKIPRTYQCSQNSGYFEIATSLHLMNMLRIVILTLISIFIGCAFAGDSYQETKPGKEKHKSEVSGSYVYFYLSQSEGMSTFGLR